MNYMHKSDVQNESWPSLPTLPNMNFARFKRMSIWNVYVLNSLTPEIVPCFALDWLFSKSLTFSKVQSKNGTRHENMIFNVQNLEIIFGWAWWTFGVPTWFANMCGTKSGCCTICLGNCITWHEVRVTSYKRSTMTNAEGILCGPMSP